MRTTTQKSLKLMAVKYIAIQLLLFFSFVPMTLIGQCDTEGVSNFPESETLYVGENCTATINWDEPTYDPTVCTGSTVPSIEKTAGIVNGSEQTTGEYTIEYTITDCDGVPSTCSFTITVEDNTPPVLSCADVVIQLNSTECEGALDYLVPLATDNCGSPVIELAEGEMTGSTQPIGIYPIKYKATDLSGNVDSCIFNVEIREHVPNGLIVKNEINFSLDSMGCSGTLLPSMVTDVSKLGCLEKVTITKNGADGIKTPAVFGSEDIGKRFEYEICSAGVCAWGYVNVEYKFKPVIECVKSDTLSCVQSFDESLIVPDVSQSCAEVDLIVVEENLEKLSCDSMFTAKMTRKYTAVDEFGNTSDTCTQTIYLQRTNLDSIVPVKNVSIATNNAIDCSVNYAKDAYGNPAPSVTGAPRLKVEIGDPISLYPLGDSLSCNGFVDYDDMVMPNSSSCVTKILRTWTVGEWFCGQTIERSYMQLIEIVDFSGPAVTCPADITVSTSGYTCESSVSVNLPAASDLCNDDNIRVNLGTPVGFYENYKGESLMMPVGVHILNYSVYDGCDNLSECTFTVTVQDNADPIAVCDQFTEVSMALETTTFVKASALDDGSFDECGAVTLEVARMLPNGGFEPFSEEAPVYCTDAGGEVMMGMLVTDAGGNTNMCMVTVAVKDKVEARMSRLDDMTVECGFAYDVDNLGAFFGVPEVFDNCPDANTIVDKLEGELNTCGSGTLRRVIRLLNAQGVQVDQDIQLITFKTGNPLTKDEITPPPAEVTVSGCGASAISPDVLGIPQVPFESCRLTSMSIENDTFPFNQAGSCLKIIRTFKVIDWCAEEDTDGSIDSPFVYEQIIKVENGVGPDIYNVFKDSTFCSFASNCGGLNLTGLTAAAIDGDNCTPANELLNKYEVRNETGTMVSAGVGLDASGYYDLGTYIVTFISEDKCGNQTATTSTFAINSCKQPTPYCYDGLSTTLTAMDTDNDGVFAEQVMLTPDFFNAGSYHPCGYDVTLSFSSDVDDTLAVFFCSDTLELVDIELWVTALDADGNPLPEMADFCKTTLDVQNNDTLDLCNDLRVDVQGRIYTETDLEIVDTKVELLNAEVITSNTNDNGAYGFMNMPTGGQYRIKPTNNDNLLNGVSTLDLVMIQRHLLGLAELTSPYKIIASDINNDDRISASDLLALRKVILGVSTEFPNNTSWRFIDESFEFVDPTNPWETSFPEEYDISALTADMWVDFIAVKVGDVNESAVDNLSSIINNNTRSNKTFGLHMETATVKSGNIHPIEVYATETINLSGLQVALDIQGLTVVDIVPSTMNVTMNDLYLTDNTVKFAYVNALGDQLTKGEKLFTIVVAPEKDGNLADMISINLKSLKAELYETNDLSIRSVKIDWDNTGGIKKLVANATPNPWNESTEVKFTLPAAGQVTLNVMEANGKLIYTTRSSFEAGANAFTLSNNTIHQNGVLLYQLKYKDQIINGKMIKLK